MTTAVVLLLVLGAIITVALLIMIGLRNKKIMGTEVPLFSDYYGGCNPIGLCGGRPPMVGIHVYPDKLRLAGVQVIDIPLADIESAFTQKGFLAGELVLRLKTGTRVPANTIVIQSFNREKLVEYLQDLSDIRIENTP